MAKDKAEKITTDDATVKSADPVETVAPDPVEVDPQTKEEKLVYFLSDMDHEDPSVWNDDGKPNLKYLTAMVGEPVTVAEVDAIDATFVRSPKTDAERAAATPNPDVISELPQVVPVAPVYTHDDLAVVDKEWAAALQNKAAAEAALKDVEKRRDPIVTHLAKNTGQASFAHVVQDMQRRTMESNLERHSQLVAFKKMTGGAVPSVYPSKLDERAGTRRSVNRRAARNIG